LRSSRARPTLTFSIDDDEIERERKRRERDMEIYSVPSSADGKKAKRRDKPGLFQKVRPPPVSEERDSSGGSVVSSILPASLSSVTGRHSDREREKEKEPKNLLERLHLQPQSQSDGDDARKR